MIVSPLFDGLAVLMPAVPVGPLVDLYSSDAVKGTVEGYIPAAAFGKCAFNGQWAGHHCESFMLQLQTRSCFSSSLAKLLFLLSD